MSGWAGALVILLGIALLLIAFLDILVTILHPTAQSLLSGRFYRTLWRVVGALARRLPRRARQRVLSWMLPASIAGLLLLWVILLLCGFAFLYLPGMTQHGAFHSTATRVQWPDAFYFSGVCLTSLGFGDIVPQWGMLRAAAIVEGLCSPLVVGVAVTYVLAVYPVLPGARILATTLNEETDGRLDAVFMVQRYLAVGSPEPLAARCRDLATQINILTEAHTTHPVLFYAHPRRVEHSFLRTLLVTQRLVAMLRYALPAASHANLVRDPRVIGLEETLIAALRSMGASLHLHVEAWAGEQERLQTLGREYDRLLEQLQSASLLQDAQPHGRLRRGYIRFRLVTDPYILAYWANSGYAADEVWSDHPPLRGTTAPLPGDDDEAVEA